MKINFVSINSYIAFRSTTNKEKSGSFYEQYWSGYNSAFKRDLRDSLKIYFQQNKDICEADIKGLAGHGGLTTVFDLGNEVLKCSMENPFEFRAHNPEFDIPFTSPVSKINNFYITRQAKADTSKVTPYDCIDVQKRMSKEGFEPSVDFGIYDIRQVGIYNERAYLLDTRCALRKPNRFSLEVYNFCTRNQRVFYPNKVDTVTLEHVEEVPRTNLKVKEAIAMVRKIIKDNKKHNFPIAREGIWGLFKLIVKCAKYKCVGY